MEKDLSKSEASWEMGKDMPEGAAKALKGLRDRIDTIDEQVVDLLATRQAVVEEVVSLKKAHHLPVHHPAREENLISERRSQGTAAGLSADYLEELFRCIMRQSRVKQTSLISTKGIRPEAAVLIVGGTSGMGRYLLHWFARSGYETRCMGRKNWPDIDALCKGVDLAIISVPIDVTVSVIQQVSQHLPKDCVLADVTSVKGTPVKAMLSSHAGPVIGLHPMFGPTTSTLDKQIVVATPGRDLDACRWVMDQFSVWGAVVVEAGADEHDEIMAVVQALRHFATFVFGQFLYRRKIELTRTLDFSSPIYRLELGMVGRLFAQDPVLYSEIIFASPERRTLLKDYLDCLNENLDMIEKGDRDLFIDQFRKIAEWFGPFSDQAMRESSYVIDKLIERF